ncbi:MAG: TetR/AcrR family transcriptional regulator [Planctomycetota bacterium]|nr:TetR/AcrR family transcriptional regulator [Planctomycetota bacterium]
MPTPLETARAEPTSLKGRILGAARSLFARSGFHGTSMRAVAREVDIDISTLYYHWHSKQELFDGILEDLQMDFEERLRTWILASKDLPIEEGFDLAVEHLGPFFLDFDVVRVVMVSFFGEDPASEGWAIRSQRQLLRTLRTYTEKRFGADSIPPEFDSTVLALISTMVVMVSSRDRFAHILNTQSNSVPFRKLVIATLRRLVGSFVDSIARQSRRNLAPGESLPTPLMP